MQTSTSSQCEHIRGNGHQCRGQKISDCRFCFAHEPSVADKRLEARRQGGYARKRTALPPTSPNVVLNTVADVESLLAQTISQVRKGALDPKIANAVGYLSGIFLRAREVGEIEDRLKVVEEQLKRALPTSLKQD